MTKYALFGAALLATTLVSHAHAEPVIEDPGYCAEFYPNANCRNLGPGNPYTDGGYGKLLSSQGAETKKAAAQKATPS
jgi:hypothetical protein